jgi:hypothetical protein
LREKTVLCFPYPNILAEDVKNGGVRKGGPRPESEVRCRSNREGLNVIDRNLLGAGVAASLVLAVAILVELETAVAVLVGTEGVGLVDLGRVGEFAICLPRGVLVSR